MVLWDRQAVLRAAFLPGIGEFSALRAADTKLMPFKHLTTFREPHQDTVLQKPLWSALFCANRSLLAFRCNGQACVKHDRTYR